VNAYELDTATLAMIGEADTAANRTAWSARFLDSYNRAYAQLCEQRLLPAACEAVTLDADGCFPTASLRHRPLPRRRIWVSDQNPFCNASGARRWEAWLAGDDRVHTAHCPLGQCWTLYRHYPDPLVNPNPATPDGSAGTPTLLEDARHGLLAMAAAADWFRARRHFDREQAWRAAFEEGTRGLGPAAGPWEASFERRSAPVMDRCAPWAL
jgi:hypothetical protein